LVRWDQKSCIQSVTGEAYLLKLYAIDPKYAQPSEDQFIHVALLLGRGRSIRTWDTSKKNTESITTIFVRKTKIMRTVDKMPKYIRTVQPRMVTAAGTSSLQGMAAVTAKQQA